MRPGRNSDRGVSRKFLVAGVVALAFVSIASIHFSHVGLALCSTYEQLALSYGAVKPLLPLRSRAEIPLLLEKERMQVGVELGVQAGVFAESTLKVWKSCKRYYLVDLWQSQPNYRDFANVEDPAHEKLFAQAKKQLAPWAKTTTFLRMSTGAAARTINETLDFVYIDARRDYCAVRGDIEVFWPKLRPGGILAGYAYSKGTEGPAGTDWTLCRDGSKHDGGVKAAVDEFAYKHRLHLVVTYKETMPYPSWLIRKPDGASSSSSTSSSIRAKALPTKRP